MNKYGMGKAFSKFIIGLEYYEMLVEGVTGDCFDGFICILMR